ncbi:MAG: hypothetical protein WCO69_00275 [Candidatus Omnitrophota bacterium]
MAKAKKPVKKSAASEAFDSPAMPSKVVLFPKPVSSKKAVKRTASKIRKAQAEAPVLKIVPVAKPVEKKIKSMVNAVCFWAGSVLSDSNAFLRLKKAN